MVLKRAISTTDDTKTILERTGITLTDDEQLIYTCRIHGAIYWKAVAVMIVGLIMLTGFLFNLGLLMLFVGAVMTGIAWLTQRFLILAASDKRVFVRSGVVYADMIELRYSQIESVEIGMTPIGQVFGYANVILTGTGQRRIIVPFVADGLSFRARVNDALVARE